MTVKNKWDLSRLYSSPNDPQIEKDLLITEKGYRAFAKKYSKNKKYLKNEGELLRALQDYKKLELLPASRVGFYLHLAQDIDMKNELVRAKANLVSQRVKKIVNEVLFFSIDISKIDPKLQNKFLKSKKLAKYKYFLEVNFNAGKHTLSEAEERIMNLKSTPAYSLWTKLVSKMDSSLTVQHDGEEIPVSEAQSKVKELETQTERLDLNFKIMDKFFGISEVAEAELNAIVLDKKINDELRGYKEPFDATILGYENDRKTVLNLVKVVTENFEVSHRFYDLKRKILKLDKIYYADRSVSIGKTSAKFIYEDSYKILSDLFYSLDPKFGEILDSFIEEGRIDAYPKVGKSGGAYCSHDLNSPTYVLLNHVDSLSSLSTFAHEMGHAIHSEFSKSQPVLYQGYSTSTAEVASTLFETFLFYDRFEKLSKEEKIVALHDKIQDDVSTIFRQVACFNFELEMHRTIREKGHVAKEELVVIMNKHMKSYLGNVEFQDKDGYFFVSWPHLRYFFYVYSYAFGQLTSKALYKKYSEDKKYMDKIKKFLSAGGSMSPEDIFKSVGVDLTKPDFFKKGIESIQDDIKTLEILVSGK